MSEREALAALEAKARALGRRDALREVGCLMDWEEDVCATATNDKAGWCLSCRLLADAEVGCHAAPSAFSAAHESAIVGAP